MKKPSMELKENRKLLEFPKRGQNCPKRQSTKYIGELLTEPTDNELMTEVMDNTIALRKSHLVYDKIGDGMAFESQTFPYEEKVNAGLDLIYRAAEWHYVLCLADQRKLRLPKEFREYPFEPQVLAVQNWLSDILS